MELNKIVQETTKNLNALTAEVGAFSVNGWTFCEKLEFLCSGLKLDEWMRKNNFEYNYIEEYACRIGYETEYYIFYVFLG